MEITKEEKLNRALGIFIESMRDYIPEILAKAVSKNWESSYYDSLSDIQRSNWDKSLKNGTSSESLIDFHNLKGFAIRYKEILKGDFDKDVKNLPTWFDEIAEVRHALAHRTALDDEKAARAFSNMKLILQKLDFKDDASEIEKLRSGETESKKEMSSTKKTAGLTPWFLNVTPHGDIRRGILNESVFAANLAEVHNDNGREVYRNHTEFFAKTYFTAGLKTVCDRVIKGLNCDEASGNRVISLQTGFGGGKTHTLISIYHLAKLGKRALSSPLVAKALDKVATPTFDTAHISVFTNATNDPVQGREVDGITIKTLWGEIAYQLGGKALYELVKKNDQERVAPAGLMKKLLEKSVPSLILIDELADYCVKASAVTVGKSTLADQTISFMQELSEAVSSVPGTVLVATLPASATEIAQSANGVQILESLTKRLSRVDADTTPVAEDEIYEVIRRRLFEDLGDGHERESVIDAYCKMYKDLAGEIPQDAERVEYKERMRRAYPFHPECIDIFKKRWASNHDFQRTRGILRILAAIVADLYKRQGSLPGINALIHTGDASFTNVDALASQLKKLYGNGYDAVITADVSGGNSNAFKLDKEKSEFGNHNLAESVVATILLGSFGSDGSNKGISLRDIKLCVCKPSSFNHNNINGVLDSLEGSAHYLYYSGAGSEKKRYWFHTKPNINILINQAKSDINDAQISTEIITRLNARTRSITTINVLIDPTEDLPEQKRPTLIFANPVFTVGESLDEKAKVYIEKRITKRGNTDRVYRNTMVFLFCTEQGHSRLANEMREYLSCKRISEEYATQLEKEQKDDLRNRTEEKSRAADSALVSAYAIITKYHAKGKEVSQIKITQFRDIIDSQINTSIFETLKNEEWLLTSVGYNTLKKNSLLPSPSNPVRIKDIYEAFIRYDDKPMITEPKAIKESLERLCVNGDIVIASGDGKIFTRMYYKQTIQFFDVEEETYWALDKSEYREEKPPTPSEQKDDDPKPPIGEKDKSPEPTREASIRSLIISGNVSHEDYSQLFASFIQPFVMKKIPVNIEVKITVDGTTERKILEQSPEYKSAQESARQLGMTFKTE